MGKVILPTPEIAQAEIPHNRAKRPLMSRLPSGEQLALAKELNTSGDGIRRHFMAGFGDMTPPDPRPKAKVVMFRGVGR